MPTCLEVGAAALEAALQAAMSEQAAARQAKDEDDLEFKDLRAKAGLVVEAEERVSFFSEQAAMARKTVAAAARSSWKLGNVSSMRNEPPPPSAMGVPPPPADPPKAPPCGAALLVPPSGSDQRPPTMSRTSIRPSLPKPQGGACSGVPWAFVPAWK